MKAVLYGKPHGQGSKRIGKTPAGKPITLDASKKTRPWRNLLTEEMMASAPARPIDAPVKVALRIYAPRPGNHYGQGRNAGKLKPNLPERPPAGGDCDKIARAVGDAGNRVWWRDDARIVWWDIQRLWADDGPERIEVEAWPL